MSDMILKEIETTYTVNADDETIGKETIILKRHGQPIAAIVPYAEYAQLLEKQTPTTPPVNDTLFVREQAAFQRLLPALLKTHRGQWIAIVDEQVVDFGATFAEVIVRVRQKFGQRPVYVQEVLTQPRIAKIPSPRVVRQ